MNWICKACRSVTDATEWENEECPICGSKNTNEENKEVETDIIWVKN